MKFLKLLFCGSVVSVLGCAGSEPAVKRSVNADDVRDRASQAYNEDAVQTAEESLQKSEAQDKANEIAANAVSQAVSGAPLSELLQSYACANADDLRGFGIAEDANAALLIAQKDIAAKIQSVVVAKTEQTRQSNVDATGNETLTSSFEAKTQVITRLQNAQDAKPIATLTQAGKYGVVACMQKADAARPFVKEASLLQDSVTLALKTFEEQKHPIVKNDAFKKARELYVRSLAVEDVLHGLGVNSEDSVKAAFDSAQQKYNEFRSQYAFYYQDENADASLEAPRRLIFERVSAKYPVRVATCSNGLLLKLNVSPAECIEKSLGLSCTATLTLNGSNCDGESYFTINAKVKGSGRYDKNEAMERLNQNIANGDWFNDWANELNKWRLE
jgi:hypothetical protein